MDKEENKPVKTIEDLKKEASPKNLKKIEEIIDNYSKHGIFPYETLQMTEEMFEAMYAHAYNFFQSGKYKKAIGYLMILNALKPSDYRTLFALAASHQHLKEYERASQYFVMCAIIQPKDPLCRFHLYFCFKQIAKYIPALTAIEECVLYCENKPGFNRLKNDALIEVKNFTAELKANPDLIKTTLFKGVSL